MEPAISQKMDREWLAWQRVVAEWKRMPDNVTNFNDVRMTAFVKAIESWGERLTLLREEEGRTYNNEKDLEYVEACKKLGLPTYDLSHETLPVKP